MNKNLDNSFIEKHKSLVARVARHLLLRLPVNIELDDLMQEGYWGLLQAAKTYDPSYNQTFESFATVRIRGAMIDYLRILDPLPREDRKKLREIIKVRQHIQNVEGREAKGSEIAAMVGLSNDEYYKFIRDVDGITITDMATENEDEDPFTMIKDENATDPMDACSQTELANLLENCTSRLTEREQVILVSRVFNELSLQEIADNLGVTESRICQIYNRVTKVFKSYLANRGYDVPNTKPIINLRKKGNNVSINIPHLLDEASLN